MVPHGRSSMNRWLALLGCCLVLSTACPVSADSVSLPLEIEGSLFEKSKQFYLSVNNEPLWILSLDSFNAGIAREILMGRSTAKAFVSGTVRVQSRGTNLLELSSRTVKVSYLAAMVPCLKVVTVDAGSPADNKVQPGDHILEVQEETIRSEEKLREVLGKHKGKPISLVVNRDGKSVVVSQVKLRNESPFLGITSELTWVSPQYNVASPPESKKEQERPDSKPK